MIERDGPEGGVIDLGRHRGGAVGRADRARHEPWSFRIVRHRRIDSVAGDPCAGQVQVVDVRLQLVVRQRDGCGVERVGLDNVGAGLQVLAVDHLDELRPGEAQKVVASFQIRRVVGKLAPAKARLVQPMGLNHGAHRPVEDGNPAPQDALQIEENSTLFLLLTEGLTDPESWTRIVGG